MRFLASNECREWCAEHGVALDAQDRPVFDPSLIHRARLTYVEEPDHGVAVRPAIITATLDALGSWSECLLWITLWGVWPSTENWPVFYGQRGSLGERRSLDEAPGHLAGGEDRASLTTFLQLVMNHGWEAHVLAADATGVYTRAFVSHDEWVSLASARPFAVSAATV